MDFHFMIGLEYRKTWDTISFIELGLIQDETNASKMLNTIEDMFAKLDYSISISQIESDYQCKFRQIDDIDRKIQEEEKADLTFEEKQRIKEIKEKIVQAKLKLDNNYQNAKDELNKQSNKD